MFFNRFKFSCRLISDFKDFLLCPQPACCLISKCVFWSFVTRFFNLLFLAKLHLWRYFAKASVGEGGGGLGDYMCCEHNWNSKLLATWVYNAKLVLPRGRGLHVLSTQLQLQTSLHLQLHPELIPKTQMSITFPFLQFHNCAKSSPHNSM